MLELLPGLQDLTSILLRRPAKIEGCQILSPQVFVPKNRFKNPKVSCSLDTHTLRTIPPSPPPGPTYRVALFHQIGPWH